MRASTWLLSLLGCHLLIACGAAPLDGSGSRGEDRAPLDPPDLAVREWIAGAARPIGSAAAPGAPGAPDADADALAAVVGDARVVGLGQGGRGAAGLALMRDHLFQVAADRLGFDVVAIDESFSGVLLLDGYVRTGLGDPAALLAGHTPETARLVDWMRRRNADPARGRALKLVGIDMREPAGSTRDLVAYLDAVDDREGERARRRLAPLAEPAGAGMAPLSPGQRQFVCAGAGDQASRLDRRREEYVARGGERAWRLARQHAAVLAQSCQRSLRPDEGAAIRARAAADNVRWILDAEGAGTRVLLWADHDQVASAGSGPLPTMGQHLREALGPGYVAIGHHVGRTSEGDAARSGTVEATFAGVAPSPWILDLRRAPASGPVRAWLAAAHPVRDVRIGEGGDGVVEVRAVLAGRFDAVLFHDRLPAAQASPGAAGGAARR